MCHLRFAVAHMTSPHAAGYTYYSPSSFTMMTDVELEIVSLVSKVLNMMLKSSSFSKMSSSTMFILNSTIVMLLVVVYKVTDIRLAS